MLFYSDGLTVRLMIMSSCLRSQFEEVKIQLPVPMRNSNFLCLVLQVRKIIESVIESETAYVDSLDVLHQYGKALGSATRTNQV